MGIWDTHEYSNVRLKLNPRPRLIPKHTTELMDTTHLGTPTNNPLILLLILVILLIPMDTPPLTPPPSMDTTTSTDSSNVTLKLNPKPMPKPIPKCSTELMDTTQAGTPTNIPLIPMDPPPLILPPSSTTSTDSSNVTLKLNPKPMLKPIPKHTTELTDTTHLGTTPTGICLLTPDMPPNLTVITVILPPTTTTITTV